MKIHRIALAAASIMTCLAATPAHAGEPDSSSTTAAQMADNLLLAVAIQGIRFQVPAVSACPPGDYVAYPEASHVVFPDGICRFDGHESPAIAESHVRAGGDRQVEGTDIAPPSAM